MKIKFVLQNELHDVKVCDGKNIFIQGYPGHTARVISLQIIYPQCD